MDVHTLAFQPIEFLTSWPPKDVFVVHVSKKENGRIPFFDPYMKF